MAAIINGTTVREKADIKYEMSNRYTYTSKTATVNGMTKPCLGVGSKRA